MIALAFALALTFTLTFLLTIAGAFVLLERFMLRVMAQTQRVLATGSPDAHEPEIAHDDTPEDRVSRQFSESSIEKGVAYLRDSVYANSGLAVPEPEVLRAEAISMLLGNSPALPAGIPH